MDFELKALQLMNDIIKSTGNTNAHMSQEEISAVEESRKIEDNYLDQALKDYCTDKPLETEQQARLVAAGYADLKTGLLTDEGVKAAEALGVVFKEIPTITLGCSVYMRFKPATAEKEVKIELKAGSVLQVVWARNHRKFGKYHECVVRPSIPLVTIYHNSKHLYGSIKWPVEKPLTIFEE